MKTVDDDIISNCCGAPFWYPGWPDSDICSKCMEHADIEEEEEEVFRKCIKCEMNTLGYLSEDKEKWICYSCYREMYNILKKEKEQYEDNR